MSQPRKPKGIPNSTGGQFDTTATTTGMGLPPMPDTTPQEPGPRPDTHRLVAAMRTMMPDRDWQPSETSPYTRTEIEQVAPVLDQYNIADSPLYTQVSRNWDVDMDTEEGLYTRFEHQPGRAASVARGMALWTYGMGRHIDTDEDRQDVENYLVDLSDGGRHLGALYALRHAPHPPFSTVGRGLFTRMRLADTPIQAQYAMMTAYRYMYTHDLVDEGMEPLANPRVDSMMDEHFTGTMRGLYADMMDDYSHHQDPQVRRLAQAYTSAYNTLPTVRDADATIPPIRLGKFDHGPDPALVDMPRSADDPQRLAQWEHEHAAELHGRDRTLIRDKDLTLASGNDNQLTGQWLTPTSQYQEQLARQYARRGEPNQ